MATEPIWLCVENHPTDGLRVSNLSGGPNHCYFTGTIHLPDCGYVNLDAARRVANPDMEAATEAMADALHRIVILPGRFKLMAVAQATFDAALGITEDE